MRTLATRDLEIPELVRLQPSKEVSEELEELRGQAAVKEWRASDGAVMGYSGTFDGRRFIRVNRIANFFFDPDSESVEAVPDEGVSRELIQDSYYRVALPLVLQARGTETIHAGAVGSSSGLLLICGASGAGKSTLCYGLGRRGYTLWADDAVAFRAGEESVMAFPLPFRVRLLPDSAAYYFPTEGIDRGKFSPLLEGVEISVEPSPIALGLLLEVERTQASEIEVERQAPGQELLSTLLGHAYCFDLDETDRKRKMIREYLRLTTKVPFFSVRLGHGLHELEVRLDAIELLITETLTRE